MSVDLLIERIVTLQNPTVVGLDPNPDAMPPHLLERAKGDNPFERAAAAVTAFNFALIDALCDIVPAVKPQLACYEQLFEKLLSNIKEVKARGANVIACAVEGHTEVASEASQVIYIPRTDPLLLASLEVVPFQIYAYYVALYKGCDIDKPRNLAKSVTVE